jgi:8-amino-3,8-dideoxy-alpha-D-manno-octulosonate transaminase
MSISTGRTLGRLALHGGQPAVTTSLPPMYPGGMRIGAEEEAAVLEVLRSKRLFRYYGPGQSESKVKQLEERVSEQFGVRYVLAVSSGGMALACSLAALGIGPGDEVIVPAYTWIATAAAVLMVGAVPVIAEVDDALTLDAEDAESRITSRTAALVPVHMRGAPCNMDALVDLASRRGLRVVEDAAQAAGARYRGKRLGSIGDIGAFSLQFNKIVTSGEGGLVTTNDRDLYERALLFHDVAAIMRDDLGVAGTFVGITCRMSELQGAVASVQLSRIDQILTDMRANFASIRNRVSDLACEKGAVWRQQWDDTGDACLALIFYLPDAAQARNAAEALRAEGVPAQVMFAPSRVDLHVAYHWAPLGAGRGWSALTPWDRDVGRTSLNLSSCPRTYELLSRAVHIDVSPDLTGDQADQVAHAIEKVFSHLPIH